MVLVRAKLAALWITKLRLLVRPIHSTSPAVATDVMDTELVSTVTAPNADPNKLAMLPLVKAEQAVGLMTHIADHFQLSLDRVSECARLLAGKTAKGDGDNLTAETTVTLGKLKAALGICNDCSKQSLGDSVVGKPSSSPAKARHEQQQLLLP